MPGFYFTGQELDNNLVASISSLLDAINVPNILWGNYLLTIYGVPTIVDGVAFVVPDSLIETSFAALSDAGFLPCLPRLDCPYSNTSRCPSPATHLHIADNLTILLYCKSDILPHFPDFDIPSKDNNSDIISASDTRLPTARLGRGQGRFSSNLSSVRIPSALKYCESIIFLLCRDYGTSYKPYWMAMLTYILEFVDGTDIFDEEELGEAYKPFYHAMKFADPKTYPLLNELRRDLMEKRLLPSQL